MLKRRKGSRLNEHELSRIIRERVQNPCEGFYFGGDAEIMEISNIVARTYPELSRNFVGVVVRNFQANGRKLYGEGK